MPAHHDVANAAEMTDHRSALDDSPNPIVSYRLGGLAGRVLDAEPPLVDSGNGSIDGTQ